MPSARSVSSRGIPCAITGCSSPSTSSASVAIRAPGEKHVPLTKTAVPRPIARSAGSGASRRTSRSAKARSSVAEPRAAGSLRAIAASELDDIRREYEQSLSWRVTRPLRALGRRVRAVRGGQVAPPPRDAGGHDAWLEHFFDDVLAPIDAACAAGGPDRFALFSELDVDLWALLLTQEYSAYPNIRALLPSVPDPTLQARWNGTSGVPLASQSAAFYRRLRDRYGELGERPLADSRVLDFGCGWGRLTRFLARDVPRRPAVRLRSRSSRSSTSAARAACRRRSPAASSSPSGCRSTSRSTWRSRSRSSRTSPSRRTSAAWRALHAGLRPGAHPRGHDPAAGVPARRLAGSPALATCSRRTRPTRTRSRGGGEMTYGETVITLPYVRERWSRWFELLARRSADRRPAPGGAHAAAGVSGAYRVPPVSAEQRAFWRELRARHPPLREALVADARITAAYPGRARRVPLAPRRRGADAAPRARQRRLPRAGALPPEGAPAGARRPGPAADRPPARDGRRRRSRSAIRCVVHPGVYLIHGQVVIDGLVEIHAGAVIAPVRDDRPARGRRRRARRSSATSASAPAPR